MAAMWKQIRVKKGVIDPPPSVEELKASIRGGLGKKIILLDRVESTNDLAMELAEKGSPHGMVVIADSQSSGKGRLGRKWLSPSGANIYMSVILRPGIPPGDATLLTLLGSVSCALALKKLTGVDVSIKWPNDLMVYQKKLGGILLEMRSESDRILFAVAGIGINVNKTPSRVRSFATSIFDETGRWHKRTPLIAGILDEISEELEALKGGSGPLLDKWRRLSSTLGKNVRVTAGKETFSGLAGDIDEKGRLIIKTRDGSLRTASSGDLTTV